MRRTLCVFAAVLALGACDSTGPDGAGSMSILMTDAPGDVNQAVVTIERIEIVGGSGGHLVLRDTPWTGDLTELTNEFVTLVDGAVLPQGHYSQLRFVISEACIGVEAADGPNEVYASDESFFAECDGTATGDLQMPSLAQTGIKVIFQGAIDVGSDQMIVLIDFDVSQSFGKLAGGSGQWVMDPTIHGVEITFSGTVNLTVELASGVTLPDPPHSWTSRPHWTGKICPWRRTELHRSCTWCRAAISWISPLRRAGSSRPIPLSRSISLSSPGRWRT